MLTKEEFKKEYIRMMDSAREKYKGSPSCNGVECNYKCPIKKYVMLQNVINMKLSSLLKSGLKNIL